MAQVTKTLTSLAGLADTGLIDRDDVPALADIAKRYAIAVTPEMARLIAERDDPIARQFIPDGRERDITADERSDPIGDHAYEPVPGVVHRYRDRALLKVTGLCPVYCRFCFRREMVGPGKDQELSDDDLDRAFAYFAAQPELFEIIVTGGDPLILSPRRLAALSSRLGRLSQVAVVRWHTRVPVVAPGRVTAELVGALKAAGKATYVALHVNHAREFTAAGDAAIARLADAGIVLLGQTVLLRGINDDPVVLAELMRALVARRVKPYYLHHPDLAPGTGHFRLPIAAGQEIVRALRGHLTGLAQPQYVLDVPDGRGKVPIGPTFADVGTEETTVTDLAGRRHRHPDGRHPDGQARRTE